MLARSLLTLSSVAFKGSGEGERALAAAAATCFAVGLDDGSLPLARDVGASDFALGTSAGTGGRGEGGTERRDMMTVDDQRESTANLCTLSDDYLWLPEKESGSSLAPSAQSGLSLQSSPWHSTRGVSGHAVASLHNSANATARRQ